MRKRSTNPMAVFEVGDADLLDAAWGLDIVTGHKLASVVALCGSLEYHMERAIWTLRGIDPKGIRPETDGKIITAMIGMVEDATKALQSDVARQLLLTWCSACRSGFTIRNNIAHGVPTPIGSKLIFCRNPLWHGEQRHKQFGDFVADIDTLDMVRQSFAVLLRVIVHVEKGEAPIEAIATQGVITAVSQARSILGEFASQDYNPSFEKY
ncbi:hypothetical protein [Rhizobium leguminosarum]|uniref:hypothetical protein n=1 Tax=Rhizobium leguminosarum TaxID=384 RepID=UPI00103E2DA4|nr:hypothetical protein [Rhizobium leguminosarum]TCA08611.1 hypothetical protein E0H63_07370 [Rhizobium leguminosarum bv. viciae]